MLLCLVVAPGSDAAAVAGWTTVLASLTSPRHDEFQAMVDRIVQGVGPDGGASPLVASRHFYRSDYHTHHRATYFTSVRMYSEVGAGVWWSFTPLNAFELSLL